MILVEYWALTRRPEATLRHLYNFLGEPRHAHDFDSVEYEADSFDLALGTRGLHRVRRKVAWVERESVLPPELFNRFVNDAFWRDPHLNVRGVPMILSEE